MGLLKLGSKLKSKSSFGSGAFGVAEDLKGLFSQKSSRETRESRDRDASAQIPRERFYQSAELNQHRTSSLQEDRSYYQKRPSETASGQSNFVGALASYSVPPSLKKSETDFASSCAFGI